MINSTADMSNIHNILNLTKDMDVKSIHELKSSIYSGLALAMSMKDDVTLAILESLQEMHNDVNKDFLQAKSVLETLSNTLSAEQLAKMMGADVNHINAVLNSESCSSNVAAYLGDKTFKYVYIENNQVKVWSGKGRVPAEIDSAHQKMKADGDFTELNKFSIFASDENMQFFAAFLMKSGYQAKDMKHMKFTDSSDDKSVEPLVGKAKQKRAKVEDKYVFLNEAGEVCSWTGRGIPPHPLKEAHSHKKETGDSSLMDKFLISNNQELYNQYLQEKDINIDPEQNSSSRIAA